MQEMTLAGPRPAGPSVRDMLVVVLGFGVLGAVVGALLFSTGAARTIAWAACGGEIAGLLVGAVVVAVRTRRGEPVASVAERADSHGEAPDEAPGTAVAAGEPAVLNGDVPAPVLTPVPPAAAAVPQP